MGVGFVLPGGGMSMADIVALAQEGERSGLTGVYVVEAWRSAFVPLAAIAAATERVQVGSYVLNAYGRSPWIAGMSALDLDDLSGGRAVIGVGSGNVFTNRMYQNLETERPLRKLAEYIEVLRRIVRARPGEPVQHDGEIHGIHGWVTQMTPVRESVPIYLAAIFPKMRRVVGRVADGIAMGAMLSTDFITERVLPDVHAGAEEAGRSPDELGAMIALFASVDEDHDVAYAAARAAIVNLFTPKPHRHYEQALTEQGYGTPLQTILSCLEHDDRAGAEAAVPEEMIETLTISGTPEECMERIASYQRLADEVLLVNVGSMRHRRDAAGESDRELLLGSFQNVIDLGGRAAQRATL